MSRHFSPDLLSKSVSLKRFTRRFTPASFTFPKIKNRYLQSDVAIPIMDTIRIWDVGTGIEKTKLPAIKVYSLALSSDGETLASGHADNKVKLWNLKTGQVVKTLAGHTEYISFLAFTRDGTMLASASNDGQIKLWDVSSGQLKQTLAQDKKGVETLSFSPNGKTLLSGGRDQDIKIWQ